MGEWESGRVGEGYQVGGGGGVVRRGKRKTSRGRVNEVNCEWKWSEVNIIKFSLIVYFFVPWTFCSFFFFLRMFWL